MAGGFNRVAPLKAEGQSTMCLAFLVFW